MAKKSVKSYERFIGGISDFEHESMIQSGYAFGRSVDVRSNPNHVTLLPKTIKESGTVVTDLIKWAKTVPSLLETYMYGNTGNIYKRTSAGSYSFLHQVPESHGNGMSYFGEDNFIYYTSDKVIGRYGPLGSSSIKFTDDYFGSQGGVPLNTNSLDLEADDSQYAYRADTASLSIVGNLSIEAQIKPESLPTSGNTMTLVSKWTEDALKRSYRFGIIPVSNYFGDGSDGALTVSTNTTDAPIDSACTGTSGTYTLSATNASFAANQIILIHQSQGTGAGQWQRNKIQSYTAGTITLESALNATYGTGAQVIVMKQYTNVTVNTGITWTAKAWNGTVGGILTFLANGTVTVTGTITASGKGFRGGASSTSNDGITGWEGEGTAGASDTRSTSANGNGGGGGTGDASSDGGGTAACGGGGGNGAAGSKGSNGNGSSTWSGEGAYPGGTGGSASGSADLTSMTFGGGGGAGGNDRGASGATASGAGGNGGGIIFIAGTTYTVTGSVVALGLAGGSTSGPSAAGGGGGGGSVLIKSQVATLGTALTVATAGAGGSFGGISQPGLTGGTGGTGRCHLDYYTSYTGTTSPTLDATQDNNLGSSDGYALRLQISTNGTDLETYSKPATIELDKWQHVAVGWTATSSTAEFFLNGVSLGTQVGALTSIKDSGETFNIGCDFGTGTVAQNFYDGLIDEVRIWNIARDATDLSTGLNTQIGSTLAGLQGMWLFNAAATDSTANANHLTLSGSPVYSTDVPYSGATTRIDIDQSLTTSGNTYTLLTAISEGAADRQTFTPAKDPQKSIAVLVATVGTGDWTLTVHDQWNNEIATKTIANASMNTGYCEFIFSSVWRPLTNFTNDYHFHVTSTVADGTVTTTSSEDLETVSYRSYYQFLVEDTDFHPIAEFLQFLVIGNERYIATIEATLYEPHQVILPSGWRIRCFGYWREYLVAGAIKGTDVTDFDSGRLYFWDGYSTTYNFYVDVPEGGINAVLGSKGDLYAVAGYKGQILLYQGGDSAQQIKQIPKITEDKYMEVYPQALTMWSANLRIGVAGGTDSTELQQGVYTYGHSSVRYPEILTFDYVISTGNYLSSVKIGMTTVIDQKLLIGWQDGTGYGVDYVDASNDCYTTGTIEMLIEDLDAGWKEKQANVLMAHFEPLDTGQSVDIKYQLNESGMWTNLGAVTTADEEVARLTIPDGMNRHIQVAVDLGSTTGTSPELKAVALEFTPHTSSGRV